MASGGRVLREGQLLLTRRLVWRERESRLIPSAAAPQAASERGSGRERRGSSAAAGASSTSSQDGGQAADPDGQREAQQEHHAARERRQDLEKRARGEGVGGAVALGSLHFRGVRLGLLSFVAQ